MTHRHSKYCKNNEDSCENGGLVTFSLINCVSHTFSTSTCTQALGVGNYIYQKCTHRNRDRISTQAGFSLLLCDILNLINLLIFKMVIWSGHQAKCCQFFIFGIRKQCFSLVHWWTERILHNPLLNSLKYALNEGQYFTLFLCQKTNLPELTKTPVCRFYSMEAKKGSRWNNLF